ncbi:hypothetical protein DYBT9275_00871 [Dyadobacter sp. CECT 9275]|uniref:Uncharacterized protein n=1 Tax=Dyadobacter helix TaxID=2822344 RepID=A0A916J7X2_9BACT|nr:hypothetical protein [Dyadobacter sp. CECT 9275]CAG4991996.1 hypothetical protein DYBT9275_00871 [Dyadobacter sp. CECT 9275]
MFEIHIPQNPDILLQYGLMITIALLLGFAIGQTGHKKAMNEWAGILSKLEYDLDNCLNIRSKFQNDMLRDTGETSSEPLPAEPHLPIEKDDLTKINGIQEEHQQQLNQTGIYTYRQLHHFQPLRLKQELSKWNENYQIRDIVMWQQQAGLAAANKWDDLRELQEELLKNIKS